MDRRRVALAALTGFPVAWLLLCIPAARRSEPENPHRRPFAWHQDALWFSLEQRFRELRAEGCGPVPAQRIDAAFRQAERVVDGARVRAWNPDAAIFDTIEANTFTLAPMIGACPRRLGDYIRLVTRTRSLVKRQSQRWDITAPSTRDRMYRLLYGGRAALEEVMLQDSAGTHGALVVADDEPSQTPFTRILGATIHSGDLLISRGGAQVSALIAVGNDYPGNFSHAALVHVDERTSLATVIESSPGTGVAVHPLEAYLADVKLRVMVLRLRADLPALVADPMIPHRAAALALADARSHRIPYDVAMNPADHARMNCSEVLSAAYERVGIRLWMGMSSISTPGITSWLSAMGVRHLEMEEPSDLEYDPQVRVVAEWRDPETLFMDHVDNVVTEAIMNRAEAGETLRYPWYMLPLGRLVKLYSRGKNALGFNGPIPDEMTATEALRVLGFITIHASIKRRILADADTFRLRHGYIAPEFQLLEFARHATGNHLTLGGYIVAIRRAL